MINEVFFIAGVLAALGAAFFSLRKMVTQNQLRKIVHLVMGLAWVVIIHMGFLGSECRPWQSVIPATFLLLYTIALRVFPSVTALIGRDGKQQAIGIIEYIILFTLYPIARCDSRLGRALMCLLGGDGLAGLAASIPKAKRTFLNPKKSYIGMLLTVLGSMAYICVYEFVRADSSSMTNKLFLSLVASLSEVLPVDAHDNILVTGLVYLVQVDRKAGLLLLLFCVLMSVFYIRRKFTAAGAVTGVLVIYAHVFLSVRAFAGVVLFGVLGTFSSSFKKRHTQSVHAGEQTELRRGRGANQVLANSLASLLFSILFAVEWNACPQCIKKALEAVLKQRETFELAAVAASAECLADTWASDIGSVVGKRVFRPLPRRMARREPVKGYNGAMSLAGTCVALLGSALIAFTSYFDRPLFALAATVAGMLGCWVDSVLGWHFQNGFEDGVLTNSQVNLISSAAAGALGLVLGSRIVGYPIE